VTTSAEVGLIQTESGSIGGGKGKPRERGRDPLKKKEKRLEGALKTLPPSPQEGEMTKRETVHKDARWNAPKVPRFNKRFAIQTGPGKPAGPGKKKRKIQPRPRWPAEALKMPEKRGKDPPAMKIIIKRRLDIKKKGGRGGGQDSSPNKTHSARLWKRT